MNVWLFFAGLVILETIADVYAKKFGTTPEARFFVASLGFYLVANASWLISMKMGMELWKGVVIFGISQALTGVIVGVCMGETINVRQWMGIGAGLLAIILILTGD